MAKKRIRFLSLAEERKDDLKKVREMALQKRKDDFER